MRLLAVAIFEHSQILLFMDLKFFFFFFVVLSKIESNKNWSFDVFTRNFLFHFRLLYDDLLSDKHIELDEIRYLKIIKKIVLCMLGNDLILLMGLRCMRNCRSMREKMPMWLATSSVSSRLKVINLQNRIHVTILIYQILLSFERF